MLEVIASFIAGWYLLFQSSHNTIDVVMSLNPLIRKLQQLNSDDDVHSWLNEDSDDVGHQLLTDGEIRI